jgi:hypothetical protein
MQFDDGQYCVFDKMVCSDVLKKDFNLTLTIDIANSDKPGDFYMILVDLRDDLVNKN